MPSPVPRTNASTVVTPTRPSVHGRRPADHAGRPASGKNVERDAEVPGRRCGAGSRSTATGRLWWVLTPKSDLQRVQRLRVDVAVERAIIARAGLPGISRGMRKLIVSAAQSVRTKNPRRRNTNLIRSLQAARPTLGLQVQQHDAPCPGTRTRPAGRTGRRRWPSRRRSRCCTGTSRPPPITGMTGTSLTMTCWSWFMIECCVAVDVVAAYWLIRASVAGLLYRS